MKLDLKKVRENMISYFADEVKNGGFLEVGPLQFYERGEKENKAFLFVLTASGDNGQGYLIWQPCADERYFSPELNGCQKLEDVPSEFEKERYEGDFLNFIVRKREFGRIFYLDYKENQLFPKTREMAEQKIRAFMLVHDDGEFFELAWKKKLDILPVYTSGKPMYVLPLKMNEKIDIYQCICAYAFCQEIEILEKLNILTQPQLLAFVPAGGFVYFDGENFSFRKKQYLSWEEAKRKVLDAYGNSRDELCLYSETCRIPLKSVSGEAFWVLAKLKERS